MSRLNTRKNAQLASAIICLFGFLKCSTKYPNVHEKQMVYHKIKKKEY
jgi:hypothetical protein